MILLRLDRARDQLKESVGTLRNKALSEYSGEVAGLWHYHCLQEEWASSNLAQATRANRNSSMDELIDKKPQTQCYLKQIILSVLIGSSVITWLARQLRVDGFLRSTVRQEYIFVCSSMWDKELMSREA